MSRFPVAVQAIVRLILMILVTWFGVCTLRFMPDTPWGWLAIIATITCGALVCAVCIFMDFDPYE